MSNAAENTVLMVILAILIPPLAVGLKEGIGAQFIINLLLWIFTWIGGVIHGLWVVLR